MKFIAIYLFVSPSLAMAGTWFSGLQQGEFSGELLAADDIAIESYRLAYSGAEDPWKLELGVGWNQYEIEYVPVLFGRNVSLNENSFQADIALTRQWSDAWSSSVNLRVYDGFSEYRSIWISEFYHQFFGDFAEYQAADPHGVSIGASTVWNYLPGSGKAEFSLLLGRDTIAPGWNFNPTLGVPEAGDDVLNTISGTLRVEQALNGWLKSELALSARSITDRDPRYSIRNTWAAAVGPVGFRFTGGYSEEAPGYDAYYGTAIAEWNVKPQWTIFAGYRVYRDSGEIEASGFNAQALGLDSTEVFAGVLWERGDWNLSSTVGFLQTDYEALSEDNQFFGNLYRDRDWLTLRLSATFSF